MSGRLWLRWVLIAVAVVLLLIAPIYVEEFWLRLVFTCCGAAVGAMGLNVLTGTAGQLSLAHAFFLASGAVTYAVVGGDRHPSTGPSGLGWPPLLALVVAVALTALVGLVVSPLSSRLSGLHLGIASLALVFIGQQILVNVPGLTGGYNGRSVPYFAIGGFEFSARKQLLVDGVPFGTYERLWYLGLVILAVCAWSVHRLLRSRHGRAMRMVRDKQLAAAIGGINVRRTKRNAFVVSSALAGLSGAMFALAIGGVEPTSFTLDVSVQYLVMIVIGGTDSVTGSILGGFFVTAAPLILQQYAAYLPLGGKVTPGAAAKYLYGAVVVAVLIFRPAGLVALLRSLGGADARRRRTRDDASPRNSEPSPAGDFPRKVVSG